MITKLGLVLLLLTGLLLTPVAQAKPKRAVTIGVCGLDAKHVRQQLHRLKFLPAKRGKCIDAAAYQGIIAFQKWQGLAADGVIGRQSRRVLYSRDYPQRMQRKSGRRVEINLNKQILFLVAKNNSVIQIINISSGKPGYSTPKGKFSVFRKERMSWSYPYSVWMPWATYFNGGIAMHQGEVPSYPASHGCVRIPEVFAKKVYRFAGLNSKVIVR